MKNEKVCLGAIVGVHGIKGEVKVKSFSDDERHLTRYGVLSNEAGDKTFDVKSVGHSKDLVRVKIKGVDDRNTAETLIGTGLYVKRDALPELSGEEYYHTDLIGLEARGKDGQKVGTVDAVYNFGAGDILELRLNDGSQEMLPFTTAFVPTVNIKDRSIIVEMMHFAADDEDGENEG